MEVEGGEEGEGLVGGLGDGGGGGAGGEADAGEVEGDEGAVGREEVDEELEGVWVSVWERLGDVDTEGAGDPGSLPEMESWVCRGM